MFRNKNHILFALLSVSLLVFIGTATTYNSAANAGEFSITAHSTAFAGEPANNNYVETDADGFAVLEVTQSEQVTKRVALVLFNFANDNSQPYTREYAKTMVFETINSYYRENSYNKFAIAGVTDPMGDVFGWYTLPNSNTTCDYNNWATAANNILAQSGIDATKYDYVFYAFPRTAACPWTGLGQLGGQKLWNNGRMTVGIVGHEFGHNLKLQHSNTYRCFNGTTRVAFSGTCTTFDYTDPYEIMGSGTFSTNYAAHFSGFNKGALGWLSDSNKLTITGSGLYTIYPLEAPATGVQSLRIPRQKDASGAVTSYYYLEFRSAYGFDNYWRFASTSPAVNGVTIRIAPDYALYTETYLIDTAPETLTFEDAPLLVGKTFTDAEKGITISPVSISDGAITVQISIQEKQQCARTNPTVTLSPSGALAADGTQAYTVKLTNNDAAACGVSTFNLVPALPALIEQTPKWVSVNSVTPGSTATFKIRIKPVPGTPKGTYQFSETATNTQATAYSATAGASYIS